MNITRLATSTGLTPANSIVIGSGILQALSIRESGDIDVVVTQEVFSRLRKSKEFDTKHVHNRELLTDGVFEIGINWEVLGKIWTYEELREVSLVIEGVRYITLEFLLTAKKSWLKNEGRSKDFTDVRLIEDYLDKNRR